MAYIVGTDRNQARIITASLNDLIDRDNSVRVIDAYVNSLDLMELGFVEYSGNNRGQSPYRRSDLLKLHIYFHSTLRNLSLILKGWGLIDGKLIAIDGTKIRAQNSKHNCITQSGLNRFVEFPC